MIVPKNLHAVMIVVIHQPHLSRGMSIRQAREIVYWPKMSQEIAEAI